MKQSQLEVLAAEVHSRLCELHRLAIQYNRLLGNTRESRIHRIALYFSERALQHHKERIASLLRVNL